MGTVRKSPPKAQGPQQRQTQTRDAHGVLQPKAVAARPAKQTPAPPPVYRPQPAPKVLQRKTVGRPQPSPSTPTNRPPAAPPVYRPQTTPRVLQPKAASVQPSHKGEQRRQPVAPPVYRPEQKRIVQPKMAAAQPSRPASAPTIQRLNSVSQLPRREPAHALQQRAVQLKSLPGSRAAEARVRGSQAESDRIDRRAFAPRAVGNISTRPATLQRATAYPWTGAQARPQRHPSYVIQPLLNEAGNAYLTHVRTNATYGSHAEAHAIATNQGFQTNIFEVRGGVLRLLTQVGTANPRAMSLLWVREEQHYKVLNGGAGLDGQPYAPGLIVHDPVGDGNCMYEAMYYIQLEGGDGGLGGLLGNAQYRAARVGFMRQTAANNLDDDLANILGEELQAHGEEDDIPIDMIYKISLLYPVVISKVNAAYPPKTYYIHREKNSLAFYGRADKAKKTKDMDALLRDDFAVKNKEDRKIVLSVMEKDRSYFPDEKKKSDEDVVEYPFPSIAPKVVYRWCSTADAKAALAGGIIKGGGIHDGIPTVPNLITKEFARSGGGVGIACADKCLEINLSLIPEIAKKQPNSLRKTPAKGGVEYKILVTIPAAAIRDITSTLKK